MEWQPIESAPKDGRVVLLCGDWGNGWEYDIGEWVERWDEEKQFVRQTSDGDVYKTVKIDNGYWNAECAPCYWMPLPAPPEINAQPKPVVLERKG